MKNKYSKMQKFIEKQADMLCIPTDVALKFFTKLDTEVAIPGHCYLIKSYFDKTRSEELYNSILEDIPLRTEKIKIGRAHV